MRIVTFSNYTAHTQPIFIELNVLPFNKLVIQRIGLQMFKYRNHTVPTAIADMFISNNLIHTHNTRQQSNLRQPVGKQEYMYRNFSFVGVYIWNYIQNKTNINVLTSYHTYKINLKQYLLHNDTIQFRII